jgi:MarR family transcriptional regulator, organic hydroperoxide resistance regulator
VHNLVVCHGGTVPVTDQMVCFAVYAAARSTTQAYRSLLEPWGLTYPQYLVLVVLWTEGDVTVSTLCERMHLDTGTVSPLLRRWERAGLVRRERRDADERVVTVALTERGAELRGELADLPERIARGTGLPDEAAAHDLIETLHHLDESMRAAATEPLPVRA